MIIMQINEKKMEYKNETNKRKLNELPSYISSNKEKFKDWLE